MPIFIRLLFFICVSILFTFNTNYAASPSGGRIVFLGKTSDQQNSVWLSVTTSGSFEVQARNQTIDQWNKSQWGLHATLSPIVSNGSGDPHSLYQVTNDGLVFLDKDNQQGGIIFPPFPDNLPPVSIMPPIYYPPVSIMPPIYYPPVSIMPPIYYPPVSIMPPIYYPPVSIMPPIYYPPVSIMPPIYYPPENILPPISYPPDYVLQLPSPILPSESQQPVVLPINLNTNVGGFGNIAPITQGREFATEPLWNIWADGRYYNMLDHRFGLDFNGHTTNFTVGADRQLNSNLIFGLMLAKLNGRSSNFDDNWQTSSNGFTVGPYVGYRFSPAWVVDGSFGYNQTNIDNTITDLNGSYLSRAYSLSLQALGQYEIGNFQLRPKPAIYYTYFHNPSYNLYGFSDQGENFSILINAGNFSYGLAALPVEASYPIALKNGEVVTVPYIELGMDYAFSRPNNGQVLTGDLTMANTSPWSGLARLGVRTMITHSLFIEATASYLSIGQPKLNIWEGRLYLSYAL